MTEENVIIEFSKKYLSKTSQENIGGYLADKKLTIAKLHLLSAVETLRIEEKISDDEATIVFQGLGIDGQRITPIVRRGRPRW